MDGLAGVGLGLLRLAHPDKVPLVQALGAGPPGNPRQQRIEIRLRPDVAHNLVLHAEVDVDVLAWIAKAGFANPAQREIECIDALKLKRRASGLRTGGLQLAE